ncbi:MAG: lipopolysaccharide heptosyltransferase II [Rhodoplanes sp.]
MNIHSYTSSAQDTGRADAPILIVPYVWLGDFVRCHTVVRLIKAREPDRPVDLLTTETAAPLLDYMPGVRKGIVCDLPRNSLAFAKHRALAARLRLEGYGQALVMSRKWKAALAPCLAGIPVRTGMFGEWRLGLINDLRFGERKLPRMIDCCVALALPDGTAAPADLPLPELIVPPAERIAWRARRRIEEAGAPVVTLAPGAIGPGKAWPVAHYAELARPLTAEGVHVWIVGGPREKAPAAEIIQAAGDRARDLTGDDLREAILALACSDAVVSNDSGLMHIAAALGRPTIAVFGPTSRWHWAPLNPLAAVLEPPAMAACPTCGRSGCADVRHRRTADVGPARVLDAVRRVLSGLAR